MLSISLALSVSFLAFCVSSALGEKDVKLYKRSAKKTGLSKSCQTTVWSTWSSCVFCDFSSVSKRTRKDGKCSTITETRPCKTGQCDHDCHEDSKTCSCHSGYRLINGKNCANINECQTKGGRGPCSQYCHDEPGSYKCFCKKGYRLKYSTKCELLDCGKPQFSNCPPVTRPTAEEDHLNICSKVNVSCLNGTKYNAECFLSCPKYYKLALKRRTIKWSDYSRFEFPNASSKIICHHLTPSIGKWHSRIDDYYCRRSNDPPMEIKLVGTSVKEKLPPGSVVGKLSTRDEQLDQDMIYSVRNSSYFRCNGSILVTMVTLIWEASQSNSYAVFIRVQDNGMPSMWREKKFLIYVENVNDVPRDIEISRNWVYENATRGTTVGVLSAIDDDLGNYRTSNFSWKLLKDKTDSFNISGSNVIVGRKLNYDVAKLFYIKVSCSDGFSSTVQNIPIYVIERPTLTLTGSHIAENSERGTVITMIKVESEGDRDMKVMITESTPNATHKLKLNPDPRCVRHTKIIKYKTTCYANITVSGHLDYEVTNGYLLQIYVTDGVISNFAKWNISVLNMNEKPTELEINGLQEIAENTIGGTDIGFLMISDPDNKNKITQTHFCRITNNGSDGKYFHIESPRNSLQIKKNKFLNYEAQQSYKIVIKCEDSGFPPLSITREFTVNVTDMDEPIEKLTLSNNRVLENSDVGAVIGILAAHDPDAHSDTSIAFALIHPTYSPFFLRGKNNEILVVNGSLNYEENSDYVITIGVTDSQDRYFQSPFVIHIIDVPEMPTDIIMDRHFMKENLETGSPISNITMIDEDSNTITTCILVKNGDGRIAVNRAYLVAGNVNADYEEDATHMIEITIKCCDQDKLCLTKDFNVSIRDVNEPPKDIIITSNLRVPEEKKNVTIGQITTVDADVNPQYNCIVISSIEGALSIDNDNQTLRLKKKLNFEKNSFVLFEITCTNRDSMPYTKQFTLNVTDVNETPKSRCLNHIFVSNNHSNGSVLASLNVTDPDNEYPKDICKPKQRLTYREISESPLPFEIIDGYLVKTGELEKNRTYVLWISVYDDGVLLNSSSSLMTSGRKEIKFNCTITCQDTSDEMITLSSNEIKEGALNFTTVGYLYMGHTHALNTTFKLIKNKCDASPFHINTNQLMLRLPWKRKISFEDTQTVPKYFHIKIREKGSQREETFIIFVKENKGKRYGICPTKVEIEISKTINRRFKLVAIRNINGSQEKCNNNSNNSRTLSYQCTTKLNLKKSSKIFGEVSLNHTITVDKDLFMTIKIKTEKQLNVKDYAFIDIICSEPKRFISYVKGSVRVSYIQHQQCEMHRLKTEESLCVEKACPEDSICSKLEYAEKRCVPNEMQLYIVVLSMKENSRKLCKLKRCLQQILDDTKSECLSSWRAERRERREVRTRMYLNILSTTKIKDENVLLNAAIWEKDVNNKLILVSPDRLPKFPDTDDVMVITPKECDLLKNFDIKCPSSNSTNSSMGKRSKISLHSIKIRVIVGLVCSILLVSIVIAVFYCLYKRRVFKQRIQKKKVNQKQSGHHFSNAGFDGLPLNQFPVIVQESTTDDMTTKDCSVNNALNNNTVDVEKIKNEGDDSHLYQETQNNSSFGKYEAPESSEIKSQEKFTTPQVVSNPFYEANDIIPVRNTNEYMNASDTNFRYSNKSGTRNDGYYETISNQKKRWFNFSNYKNSKKNKNIHKNTNRQKTESDVDSKDNGRYNDARYESLPLPNERQINEWKMRIQQGILNDSFQPQETIKGSTQTLRSDLLNPRERSKQDDPANKYPFYEEVAPPVKNRKDSKKSHNANGSESSSPYYHELEQTKIESDQKDKTIDDGPEYFVLEQIDSTSKVNKHYQSLHRELEGPLPAYEPYRPPETSDKSESGDLVENDSDVKA